MVDWSNLPEELLILIAVRLYSVVELLRFRSICKSWRSSISVADNTPFPNRPPISLNPLVITVATANEQIYGLDLRASLSRASFFRLTLSSSSQGWLIKYDADHRYGTFRLINPLSRSPLRQWCESINLLNLSVSEIQQAYIVQSPRKKTAFGFKRLVLGAKNRIVGVGCDGKIRYWNGEIWTRIKEQVAEFCDIIVHKRLTYALDSKGIIWWISSSLGIFRYGPSLDEYITKSYLKERNLVECSGELYIVDRLIEDNHNRIKPRTVDRRYMSMIHDDLGNTKCELTERYTFYYTTVGFKVYKMDEELGKWVQVKSLGDNALVLASDTCFSVSANEFYGCLQNSIYFADEDADEIRVFKLEDGSITTMSGLSQSCFQMFVPSFG